MKPKRYLNAAILGLSSFKIGTSIASKADYLYSIWILKAQLDHDNIINQFPEQTHNF